MNHASEKAVTLLILSDIHYAGAAERARGSDYEIKAIAHPLVRALAKIHRHFIWMRDPFARTPHFDRFLTIEQPADQIIVNGDFTSDSGFIGLSDPAAFASAVECLEKLKTKFSSEHLQLVIGDHEPGKKAIFTGGGGMKLASWQATIALGLKPFWLVAVGNYVLMAVASPLLALPAKRSDTAPEEWPEWQRLREIHLAEIRAAFAAVAPHQKILLFCHDPTALPFLAEEEIVRQQLPQIEQTIIGHLHTNLVVWKSRLLAGIPPVKFLGRSVHKFTAALHQARWWKTFKVRLCPALAGIELLNDGGYFTVLIDPAAQRPAQFVFHLLRR